MNESQKYGRSLHAQISLGTTSDDRFMPNGYIRVFAAMLALRLSEKLDGQNNCFNRYGVFARSHTAPSIHPWDKPLVDRWQLFKNDLGDLEIFGENMYATHSIKYTKLESFFYVFGVRHKGVWLPWEEVCFYANMLDFPVVPTIEIKVPLKDFYKETIPENVLLEDWFKENLGMTWVESTKTSGLLGGVDIVTGKPASEGFVVNAIEGGLMNGGIIPVADNEFNTLFKVVRPGHINTDEHWTKNWKPAELVDYHKYGWSAHEYLSVKKEKEDKVKNEKKLKETIFGYEDIGRVIQYKGKYGVLVLSSTLWPIQEGDEDCVVMRWDERREMGEIYSGGNWMPEFVDEPHEFKHINMDGTLKIKEIKD